MDVTKLKGNAHFLMGLTNMKLRNYRKISIF